jgi:hypothetical protein
MFDIPELQLIRAGLDVITIKGADAKFLAHLQLKVEQHIQEAMNPPKTVKDANKDGISK